MRASARLFAVWASTGLAGCDGRQSALVPHAIEAAKILHLFVVFLVVAAVVWLSVALMLAAGLGRRKPERAGPLDLDRGTEHRFGTIVLGCAVATGVTVVALSVLSYLAQDTVLANAAAAPLQIKVLGHQWWWEVEYESPWPDQIFVTANEIHVPVGQPVTLKLETRDVIHSFWVPSLNGKTDLINEQENDLRFTVDHPGVYRGQCAEFCGLQHAHMGFEVVAESPAEFEAWRRSQLEPAVSGDKRGDMVFRGKGCALCHTIRGTMSSGKVGPDLTHLASRRTIAAAELPLNQGNLAAWIADPQHIKPGNQMPQMPLDGPDVIALAHYLGTLQ